MKRIAQQRTIFIPGDEVAHIMDATLTNRGVFKYQDEFYEIKASEAVTANQADFVILSCQYTNKPDDF
jgi:hypothetical protein